jgi:ubiquitin C-terminal hydrolase
MNYAFGCKRTGNTCYFISLYQAIIGCKSFWECIAKTKKEVFLLMVDGITTPSHAVFARFVLLRYYLEHKEHHNIEDMAEDMLKQLKLPADQQCVHEALTVLMGILKPVNVSQIFLQKRKIVHLCGACLYESHSSITQQYSLMTYCGKSVQEQVLQQVSIMDKKCGKCGHANAVVLDTLQACPEVLVLFSEKYQVRSGVALEIDNKIEFPSSLAVFEKKYDLASLIEHVGNIDDGHYYCVSKRGNQWFMFDDRKITEIQTATSGKNTFMAIYC